MLSVILTFALTGASAGEPTYLRCVFPGREDHPVMITADESNSRVSVSLPSTGHSESMSAAFTPTEVRFSDRSLTYVISRTDLTVRRTIRLISSTDVGSCTVEEAPQRAF